jgi:oligopeptide transport system substrate-binding protein
MDPATNSEYAWIWEYTNIVGAIEAVYDGGSLDDVGITAVDDYTLEVELMYPTPYFVSLMGFYHFMPVKQAAVEAVGGEEGLWAKDPDLAVCNGPFMLTSYTSGVGLTLEPNPEYWNAETVYLEQINGKFIDLETTAYVAYNAGELDVLPSVPTAMTAALIAEDPEFYVFPVLGTYYYNFNVGGADDIWDNLNLRKALTYAIDRTAITEALAAGQVPATGFVAPGFLDENGNDFAEESGDYGIPTDDSKYAEAVTLFATAATEEGMTVTELQDYLYEMVILYNTSESHKLVAEMVQESWRTVLGIELNLQNQDWAVFQDTRENGNYDVARGGWLTDFMDPAGLLAIFTTDNAYNDPGYSNAAYDTLMADAQSTTDPATHFAKLYQAEAILMEDLPILPVYYYADIYLIRSTVTGWGRSILGSLDFTHAVIVAEE